MGKKRRVRWIVGALAVSVVLFVAVAFLVGYNSTDARMERAVARIVEEHGFKFQYQSPIYLGLPQRRLISNTYLRTPVSAESASEIVAILSEACPSCKYRHMLIDGDNLPEKFSGPIETHNFRLADQDGGLIASIAFNPNNRGYGDPEVEPEAVLLVSNFERPSLWQRIKGLWPW